MVRVQRCSEAHLTQMMMREQDQAIDSIAGTLNTIQQQASLMGQEINVHNEYALAFFRLNDSSLI
jgi:phage tail tape-measure protein